ncbi:hypothetical protein F2Q70_00041067 [Brassica cretica]|uniref:Uncharacterized protein n=1 Tax=Brassica cretica TaxID=69181 RepID=A0A8S9K479_BRACR|nr:hypothetical protein F2Q70_00041067 [Brassica cretica]KAF3495054.1 hypothetical protein DY000_02056516 [Brassica cretica]
MGSGIRKKRPHVSKKERYAPPYPSRTASVGCRSQINYDGPIDTVNGVKLLEPASFDRWKRT